MAWPKRGYGRRRLVHRRVVLAGVAVASEQTATVAFSQSSTLAVTPLVEHPATIAFAQSSTLALGGGAGTVTLTAGTPFQATGSVTSGVVNLPSGLTTDDWTFLFCTLNASSGVITGPAGWSTAFASAQSTASTSHATAIYYRKFQSGDTDPTVTCTSGRLAVLPVKASGADGTNPIEGTVGSTTQAAATTSVDAPSQTSTASKLLVTAHAGRSATNGIFITWTEPSGMTEVGEAGGQAAAATNASIEVCSKVINGGDTTGAQTATASSTATGSRGISMLLAAAAGGGSPVVTHPYAVAFASTSTLAVTADVTGSGQSAAVAFDQTSSLAVTPLVTHPATVAFDQSSSLAVTPLITHPYAVALDQSSTLAVTPLVTHPATVALAQSSTLAVTPLVTHPATVALAQTSTLAVTALVTHPYAVTLAQTSTLSVSGFQTIPSTVTFASTSTLGVAVQGQQFATVAFAQTSALTVAALITHPYAVAFGQTSTLAVTAALTHPAVVVFVGSSALQVTGTLLVAAVVAFVSSSTLDVTAVSGPPTNYEGGPWRIGDGESRWSSGGAQSRWTVGAGVSRWSIGG